MLLIDRRYLRYFDWLSFFLVISLSSIWLLFVFSATYKITEPFSFFFKKQLFGVLSGLCIYFIFCCIDYRTLYRWGYFFYYFLIAILVITLVKGSTAMGGQRWINLFFFKFQPSELAKLLLPSYITYYCYTQKNFPHLELHHFWPIIATLCISFILILKQPDLGTALIVLISGLTLIRLAGTGINQKFFIMGALIFCITAPLSWKILKPYQKQRILVFLGQGEQHKERYQIEQSKIAIGSGGILGKGFLQGTQNKLMFLPESRTDFIFSVIAEEFGFMGTSLVLLLFLLLFFRILYIIRSIKNASAQLLATGLTFHIALSTIINIAMVIGLLPIVGIPLPFISYGIAHLWITFASLGWFNGIAMRRFYINLGQ
jgi:rod shape determining protein RodA